MKLHIDLSLFLGWMTGLTCLGGLIGGLIGWSLRGAGPDCGLDFDGDGPDGGWDE